MIHQSAYSTHWEDETNLNSFQVFVSTLIYIDHETPLLLRYYISKLKQQ